MVSIDPYPKWESARLTALDQIERAGFRALHRHIHTPSELALPLLVRDGFRADFVYVDGHHGFDHVFIDMFYSDMLMPVGGAIAFNDAGWRSVHKVIRFLLKYRKYRELNVGLPCVYHSRNILFRAIKRAIGRSRYDRYFQKTDPWSAPYTSFRNF